MSLLLYSMIILILVLGGAMSFVFAGLIPGLVMLCLTVVVGILMSVPPKGADNKPVRGSRWMLGYTETRIWILLMLIFCGLAGVVGAFAPLLAVALFIPVVICIATPVLKSERLYKESQMHGGAPSQDAGNDSVGAPPKRVVTDDDARVPAKRTARPSHEVTSTSAAANDEPASTADQNATSGTEWIERAKAAMVRYQSAESARDWDAARNAFGDMRQAYVALKAMPQLANQPHYWEYLGCMSTMMALWCADEGDIDLDAAREYADTALDALEKATSKSSSIRQQLADMATLARTIAAFVAFMQDRRSDVANLLKDGPHNAYTLAMLGVVFTNSAIEQGDVGKAQGAKGLLTGMDQCARADLAPGSANSGIRQYVLAFGYYMYAQLLAYGANTFPGAGFANDVRDAIASLERGRSYLADPDIYADQIDELLAELRAEM